MAMSAERPTFEDPALQREIMHLREVNNHTNIFFLVLEYSTLAVVAATAINFAEFRQSWGIGWGWNIPVFAIAIVLIGGIQHRLAGLGHESSHYSFMRNRLLNDLVADVFCMFPLFTTIHFYRLFHMGHHQFTNDPERDPDLQNLGPHKRSDEFPMPRDRLIAVIYFCFLVAPLRFLRYQWAYVVVNALGQGKNVYVDRANNGRSAATRWPRLATVLGLVYLVSLAMILKSLTGAGRPDLLVPAGLVAIAVLAIVIRALPSWALFHSPLRNAYSPRVGGFVRMVFYTVILTGLAYLRWETAGKSAVYPLLLWFVPLGTSFPFFMFLRDVYQHSNADHGRLTNSRVFFTDPFTRWAVLVYGQDMHIPHHLFPAIPHFRLRRLHELLKGRHDAYRTEVVETHGTFRDQQGRPTILDELTRARAETPAAQGPMARFEGASNRPPSSSTRRSIREKELELAAIDQDTRGEYRRADDAGHEARIEVETSERGVPEAW
jgi:fatty acid desaturase